MPNLLRMLMALGGWRLLGRQLNRWADRGTSPGRAGKQAVRQRRRTAGAALRGVRVLTNIGRWMR